MKEDFLHYIWKHRLFDSNFLITDKGEKVELIATGESNTNAGPDFLNAKIKINNITLIGNIEIHINSSDWDRHKHNFDKSYNNVILQLVNNDDKVTYNQNGKKLNTIKLVYNDNLLNTYNSFKKNEKKIPCEDDIKNINDFHINFWLNSLLIERIEQKTAYIKEILLYNKNSWEESFYQVLARNFGFKVNALPFELLAKSLPSKYLGKHKNSLFQLEAMIFGQAGFLDAIENKEDEYFNKLYSEYHFLKQKFKLVPIEKHLWKFLRLRPSNFPTIRLAQFASLVYKSKALFSKIIKNNKIEDISGLFNVEASEYWDKHYNFGKPSVYRKKKLGVSSINNIIINSIVPFLFLYGKEKSIEKMKDYALHILDNVKAENNSIIKTWTSIGFNVKNAYYSQALIHLKTQYCNKNRCLDCQISATVLKKLNT